MRMESRTLGWAARRNAPCVQPVVTVALVGASLLAAAGCAFGQAGQPSTPPAVAVLHTSELRQPIYGFGGTQTYNGDLLADFSNRDAVYRALFSDLRLDILRLRNYYGYAGQEKAFEARTREFARGALRRSDPSKRGGKAPVRLMFTSWSPPADLKSNGRVSGRSDGTDKGLPNATLRKDASGQYVYGAFADWWLASVGKFRDLCGAYPDYIALQNELDLSVAYEGCRFLPTEGRADGYDFAGYDRALAAVSDRLTGALGARVPRIVGPETFTIRMGPDGKSHVQMYADPTTDEGRAALARLFGVSFHIYGSGAETPDHREFRRLLDNLHQTYRPKGAGKPLFQTEFIEGPTLTQLASNIHDTLAAGGASAYLVWILARSVRQPGFALVYYNPYDGSVERRERFYAVKHFSAFVGEGWRRVEAECADPEVRLSAYLKDGGGALVAVLINPTSAERRVALKPDGAEFRDAMAAVYRSTEGEDGERWREMGAPGPGGVVVLPPRSVATVKYDRR